MEWINCTLGDIITFQRGHDLPKNQMKDGTIPVVGSNGIIGYHNVHTTEAPSITVGRSGNVGNPFIVYGKTWSHNTTLYIKEFKASDPVFVYYYLKTLDLANFAGGSAVPTLNRNHIHSLQIRVPKRISEQKIIGQYLKAIDDKIICNKAINDNLSDQLQSVYQHRFNRGGDCLGQGTLSDICCFSKDRISVSSLSASTYYSTENMLPEKAGAVDATSLPAVAQTTKCKMGDVLISNIRPYFKKIVYCQNDCGCSADVLCFTPKHYSMSAYLFCTLYADRFFDFMVAGSKGTKMPRGDKQQIMTYSVSIPSETEIESFNELAIPMLTQIESNRIENIRLSALRDALLPKLMSGEIDVSDVQI